jgi:putative ABC transport system permease protein
VPETVKYIEEISTRFASNFPFEYSFLDQGIGDLYQNEQRLGKIFGYFAFLAIFISCLGIFGLSAFTAEQKTKEIGIRKILGASVSKIVVLLSTGFARWVLLANLIAWPIAWYVMNKWLENFAYRASLSFEVFILGGSLSLAVAAFPVAYHALRAATANPVDALRYE